MSLQRQFTTLANYNRAQNEALYQCCAQLSDEQRREELGLFFGSIHATLNHILLGDTLWLRRFCAQYPDPQLQQQLDRIGQIERLDQILFEDYDLLHKTRIRLDHAIQTYMLHLNEDDFAANCAYSNTKGESLSKPFSLLLLHFFNHQTHHRGQLSTALQQLGHNWGDTDLVLWID
ncbi:MAG: DinB family protein [Pseudomonadales bacterium]